MKFRTIVVVGAIALVAVPVLNGVKDTPSAPQGDCNGQLCALTIIAPTCSPSGVAEWHTKLSVTSVDKDTPWTVRIVKTSEAGHPEERSQSLTSGRSTYTDQFQTNRKASVTYTLVAPTGVTGTHTRALDFKKCPNSPAS